MPVTVTETAAREIHRIILEQELALDKIHLRVGVKGGGCSGFNYLLDLTETQKDTDEVWEHTYTVPAVALAAGKTDAANEAGSGVAVAEAPAGETFTLKVICDPKSYLYLNGTVIDFRDELMGRGFVFNNPNATSSCGCGSSFSA
jgi:Fe-S cluster assembly iron-binding protein IscA